MSTRRDPAAGALSALAFGSDLAHDALLGTVRDVHLAVADRVFGPSPSGVRRISGAVHGGVSRLVYAGVGRGLQATSAGLRSVDTMSARRPPGPDGAGWSTRLEEGRRGRFTLAALNGLFGDRIRDTRPELAITMAVRHRRHDVPLETEALGQAHPGATGSLAVFLHGLSEDETCWELHAERAAGGYPALLTEQGWTPVQLRMNSGLAVAENGVALASLLGRLVDQWPVPVTRIALIGHSLGGLVMRAAGTVQADGTQWLPLLSDVVTLGTPHLGAPIAGGLTTSVAALGRLPESAPFGRFLDHRSVGIQDLRLGLGDTAPPLPGVQYHLVAGTVAGSRRHLASVAVGDLLVREGSALGRGRHGRRVIPRADTLVVPGADHFDLLNHPDVASALGRWLAI